MNEIDRAVNRANKREARAAAQDKARADAIAAADRVVQLNILWPKLEAEIARALARLKAKGYPNATKAEVRDGFLGRKVSRVAWQIGEYEYPFMDGTATAYYYLTSSGHIVRDSWYSSHKPLLWDTLDVEEVKQFLAAIRRLGQ